MHTCLQRELERKNAPEIKSSKKRTREQVEVGGVCAGEDCSYA